MGVGEENLRKFEPIKHSITAVFADAQNSVYSHQKNCAELERLFDEASKIVRRIRHGFKGQGIKWFADTYAYNCALAFQVKKGDGDSWGRTLKFVSKFMEWLHVRAQDQETEGEPVEDLASPIECFTKRFVEAMICQIEHREERTARNRALSTMSAVAGSLGEIEQDTYEKLKRVLIHRLCWDKEASVRAEAALSLAAVCHYEQPGEFPDIADAVDLNKPLEDVCISAQSVLRRRLHEDSYPAVKRAILGKLHLDETTLPDVLDLQQDRDPSVRAAILKALSMHVIAHDAQSPGTCHPKELGSKQLNLILQFALGDKDDQVAAAAKNLVLRWLDAFDSTLVNSESDETDARLYASLHSLVQVFRVATRKPEKLEFVAKMVQIIFAERSNGFKSLTFTGKSPDHWKRVARPEQVFVARAYADYLKTTKQENPTLDDWLPPCIDLVSIIRARYTTLTEYGDDGTSTTRKKLNDQGFILEELLRLALNLDYGDHVGAKAMQSLMEEMLLDANLQQSAKLLCIEVLDLLLSHPFQFVQIMLRIVNDLRETVEASFELDLHILSLCQKMLELLQGNFERNKELPLLYKGYLLPVVQETEKELQELHSDHVDEPEVREALEGAFEQGVRCMALVGMLVPKLSFLTFQRLLNWAGGGITPSSSKVVFIRAAFDLAGIYKGELIPHMPLNKFHNLLFDEIEKQSYDDETLGAVVIGLAKLALQGDINEPMKFCQLFRLMISPQTIGNQYLQQGLDSFFRIYACMSARNQEIMQQIFIAVYIEYSEERQEWDGEGELLKPSRLCEMFEFYTSIEALPNSAKEQYNSSLQLRLIEDILEALCGINSTVDKNSVRNELRLPRDDRRALFVLLPKLCRNLPSDVDEVLLQSVKTYADGLEERRLPTDLASRNAFIKFQKEFAGKFEEQLRPMTDDDYLRRERLRDILADVESIIPLNEDEDGPQPRGRKRRSVTSTVNSDEEDVKREIRETRSSKRRRLGSNQSSSPDDLAAVLTTPKVESRECSIFSELSAQPGSNQGAAADNPIVISSDEEEPDDDHVSHPARVEEEDSEGEPYEIENDDAGEEEDDEVRELSHDLSHLQTSAVFDSIMDTSDPEDDDDDDDDDDEEDEREILGDLGLAYPD